LARHFLVPVLSEPHHLDMQRTRSLKCGCSVTYWVGWGRASSAATESASENREHNS
jgi:hypothetical protein